MEINSSSRLGAYSSLQDIKMKMKRGLKTKDVALLGILILTAVLLSGLVKSQEGQEAIHCAERTISGASCQNVPLNEVDTDYRYDRTSCESTSYCSKGTCVNTATGECLPGPQATCDPEEGGFFYNQEKDEVAQCQVGCCLLGDGASLVERVRCDVLGKDYNVNARFRTDITDENVCLTLASPEAKGACVFETEGGRDCNFITRGECQTGGGEFHEGFLCTAPELGTLCAKTQRTTCVDGKNEVYFVDSCNNLANIYDANKIDDIAYWSFIPGVEGVEIDFGDGKGNIGSSIYGACDYLQGSTCGPGNARFGNNICTDLRCTASQLTGNIIREHGEEWCSEPIRNFENAKPGQTSYLLYCYNGEVQYEICDSFRNKICLQNEDTGTANCVVNLWQVCGDPEIETTRDCLDAGDCRIEEGGSIAYLRTQYGTEKLLIDSDTDEKIVAACVPKYAPGFQFWDPEDTILDTEGETPLSICEFSSVTCFVKYTQEIILISAWRVTPEDGCVDLCKETEGWSNAECHKACTPVCLENLDDKNADAVIERDWAQSYQNLCGFLGDCGVKGNYLGKEGYNRWRDLFKGEQIDWSSLINAEDKK